MSQGDLAAWVQAIGSIAAIGAAIWIDRGSARREREWRLDAQKATLAGCSRLVSVFRVKAEATLSRLKEHPREDARVGGPVRRGFQVVASTLHAYPIASIPRPDVVLIYCDVLQLAELINAMLDDIDGLAQRARPGEAATVTAWAIEHLCPLVEDLGRNDDALRKIAGV